MRMFSSSKTSSITVPERVSIGKLLPKFSLKVLHLIDFLPWPEGPEGEKSCRIFPALRETGTGLSPPVSFADIILVRGGRGLFQHSLKNSPRRRTSGDGGLCFVGNHHGQISSVSEGFIGFVHVDLDIVYGFHRAPPFPICRGSMLKGLVVFVQQLFDLLNDFHGVSSLFHRRSALEGSVVIVQELLDLFKGFHNVFSFRCGVVFLSGIIIIQI